MIFLCFFLQAKSIINKSESDEFVSIDIDKVKFHLDEDMEFQQTVNENVHAVVNNPDDIEEFTLCQITKVYHEMPRDDFHLIKHIKTPLDLLNDQEQPRKFVHSLRRIICIKYIYIYKPY